MTPLWLPFWPLLEMSNGFSIVFVVVCLFTMITFIIRLTPGTMSDTCVQMQAKPVEPQSMALIKNPFTTKLSEESVSSKNGLEEGLTLVVSSDHSFWFVYYWGVDINAFHSSLRMKWDSMKSAIFDNYFLENFVLDRSEPQMFEASQDKQIIIKPSTELSENALGESPRTRYPLVTFLVLNEDDVDEELKENAVMSLVNVVHVKDSVCQMETNIISQFLKQRNDCVLNLQTLFTPESSTDSTSENSSPLCVVCQDVLISRALLPCRHACVCSKCFEKLDKCPLCRSYIHSFFNIRPDNATDAEPESEPDVSTTQKANFMTRLSSKINCWFGFH